jgi:hypothetical protein
MFLHIRERKTLGIKETQNIKFNLAVIYFNYGKNTLMLLLISLNHILLILYIIFLSTFYAGYNYITVKTLLDLLEIHSNL